MRFSLYCLFQIFEHRFQRGVNPLAFLVRYALEHQFVRFNKKLVRPLAQPLSCLRQPHERNPRIELVSPARDAPVALHALERTAHGGGRNVHMLGQRALRHLTMALQFHQNGHLPRANARLFQ